MSLGSSESKQPGGGVADSDGRTVVRQIGSPTSIATVVQIGSGPVAIAAANGNRHAINLYNGGAVPLFLGYGATAVASAGWPLPAGASWEEADFNGAISAVSPGATQPLFVVDIG